MSDASLPPIALTFAALVIAMYLGQFVRNRWSISSNLFGLPLPLVNIGEDKVLSEELIKAMNLYPDEPFRINTAGLDAVVLPYKEVDKIKNLPENIASFKAMIYDMSEARYTGARDTEHQAIEVIKGELSRNVSILSGLQEEVKYILNHHIKSTPTWTPVNVCDTAIELVGGMTARIFVGLPLCRDGEWLDATIHFPQDLIASIVALKTWHPIFRPLVSIFSPEFRKLQAYRGFASKKLGPYVKATKGDPHLANWILSRFKDPASVSAWRLAIMQMNVAIAAIDSSGLTLQHIVIDLASYSQYIPELRQEIDAVLREERDGQLHRNSLPKLRKLDSFIKESQRMNPPLFVNINRKVTAKKGLKLSTGHVLPHGTLFGFPHPHAPGSTVSVSKLYSDKDQPSFNEFAPWRYFNLRKIPGEEIKHQFVTISADSPVFGAGPQACPGRFFANDKIKIAVVELLKRYDFALGPNGENTTTQGFTRPAAIPFRTGAVVAPNTTVYIRERAD